MATDEPLLPDVGSTAFRALKGTGSRFRRQHKSPHLRTLLGFICGFLAAFVTVFLYDQRVLLNEQLERHTTDAEYYQTGYMNALQEAAVGVDASAQRLLQEVRVLCMVLTCVKYHQSRARHVRATWGKRCTHLIFVSDELDEDLGAVPIIDPSNDAYENLWNKTREGFRYVYEHHFEKFDWFLKADDDAYVIMENLRYMLYGYPPENAVSFGYHLHQLNQTYASGGAAYVLSKEALRRFMEQSFDNETICDQPHSHDAEDFNMARCLQNVDVQLIDTRFAVEIDTKPKMFPLEMASYMHPKQNESMPDWMFDITVYPIEFGLDCCSNYSVAFHYVDPTTMYVYEFLLYHLQVVGQQRQALKLPAKQNAKDVQISSES